MPSFSWELSIVQQAKIMFYSHQNIGFPRGEPHWHQMRNDICVSYREEFMLQRHDMRFSFQGTRSAYQSHMADSYITNAFRNCYVRRTFDTDMVCTHVCWKQGVFAASVQVAGDIWGRLCVLPRENVFYILQYRIVAEILFEPCFPSSFVELVPNVKVPTDRDILWEIFVALCSTVFGRKFLNISMLSIEFNKTHCSLCGNRTLIR